jgi:hypothetical protein
MSAANYDLVIDQGSTFAIDLTVKESGVAKNLTGYSARAQMRSTKTAASVSGTFTCTVLNPASDGVLKMELPASTSSAMSAGLYFYDLEIHTGSDSIVKRLLEGKVTINQEVTR